MNALKIPTDVLNTLERPAFFSVEPSQNMFDLVMRTFPGQDVLKARKSRNLSNAVVNLGMKTLVKEDRDAGTARTLSSKE